MSFQDIYHPLHLILLETTMISEKQNDIALRITSHQPGIIDDEFAAGELHCPVMADSALLLKKPSRLLDADEMDHDGRHLGRRQPAMIRIQKCTYLAAGLATDEVAI